MHRALKGRHNRCHAHSGLGSFWNPKPRALPWAEQKAIASVLGSLDDLIEANREITAGLEAVKTVVAQAELLAAEIG